MALPFSSTVIFLRESEGDGYPAIDERVDRSLINYSYLNTFLRCGRALRTSSCWGLAPACGSFIEGEHVLTLQESIEIKLPSNRS